MHEVDVLQVITKAAAAETKAAKKTKKKKKEVCYLHVCQEYVR